MSEVLLSKLSLVDASVHDDEATISVRLESRVSWI